MKLIRLIALFVTFGAAILLSPPPISAYNDDANMPAAFVEGTRDYTIKFFDRMRQDLLEKYINKNMLIPFDVELDRLKTENAELVARIAVLKNNKEFLTEKDAKLIRYRKHLADLTDIMFGYIQALNKLSAEELQKTKEKIRELNKK